MKKIFIFDKESLTFKNIKISSYIKTGIYLLGIFIILFILGWFTGTNKYVINKITNKTNVTDTLMVHKEPFSEEALIRVMINSNIKFPHIVLAQAKLESGGFKSKIFKQNNNMFGMRMPRQRSTTAVREQNGFAFYHDWIDCLYDYALYQANIMSKINDDSEYFSRLEEKYCTDTGYVTSVKNIIKKEHLKQKFDE